jgi:hypothetical protein
VEASLDFHVLVQISLHYIWIVPLESITLNATFLVR